MVNFIQSLISGLNIYQQFNNWLEYFYASPIYLLISLLTYYLLTASLLSIVNAILAALNIKLNFFRNKYVYLIVSITAWWHYNAKKANNQMKGNHQENDQSDHYWTLLFMGLAMWYLACYACEGIYYIAQKCKCEKQSNNCQSNVLVLLIIMCIASLSAIVYLSKIKMISEIEKQKIANSEAPNLVVRSGNLFSILLIQMVLATAFTLIHKANCVMTIIIVLVSHLIIIVRMVLAQYVLKSQYSVSHQLVLKFVCAIAQGLVIFIFAYSGKQWHKTNYLENKKHQIGFQANKIKYLSYCKLIDSLFEAAQYFYFFCLLAGKQCAIEHFLIIVALYLLFRKKY